VRGAHISRSPLSLSLIFSPYPHSPMDVKEDELSEFFEKVRRGGRAG